MLKTIFIFRTWTPTEGDDEPNPEDEDLPEGDGDEDDEFLKLNLPDSYRIFFEFGEPEDDQDREDQAQLPEI